MQIQVNGELRTVGEGITVAELLRELDIPDERVAVEVNLSIIEKKAYHCQHLHEGDRVEILSFIGGGSFVRGFELFVSSCPSEPVDEREGVYE